MKTKILLSILFAIFLGLNFSSCSSDDEEEVISAYELGKAEGEKFYTAYIAHFINCIVMEDNPSVVFKISYEEVRNVSISNGIAVISYIRAAIYVNVTRNGGHHLITWYGG